MNDRLGAACRALDARPVIAILASDCGILYDCNSYIPASYVGPNRLSFGCVRLEVHLLQQGGAQVVPLYPQMEDLSL